MRWIHTPEDIMADGVLYLKIYVYGLSFLLFYNVCTGIFTALGDSKTPLYFLIGSSLGNIFLDYLFVAQFQWGVAGVAWATFLAQGVSAVPGNWRDNRCLTEVCSGGSLLLQCRALCSRVC